MAAISLQHRLEQCSNPLLKKLYKIMVEKKTNLCLAVDNMSLDRALEIIERVGKHICILKIHFRQFGHDIPSIEMMNRLCEAKRRHNFLLFEDAKFYDGAETVRADYEIYFARYIDIVTVVPTLGDGIFQAIEKGSKNVDTCGEPRGCLAVCELSFANTVEQDTKKLLEIAERNSPICIGIIGQKLQPSDRINMIKATPGVHLSSSTDGTNQQWRTPEKVLQDGADIIIVGRGITSAPESELELLAIKYKEQCFRG